jgi:hypothetical protein
VNHPHRADPLAAWFAALELLGEDIQIRLGRAPAERVESWFAVPHTERDGAGALAERLRGQDAQLLPVLRRADAPSWTARLLGIARLLTHPAPSPRPFAQPLSDRVGACSAHAWRVLSTEETAAIDERAKRGEVSTNSWLIYAWHRAIEFEFASDSRPALYHVPVNMRTRADAPLHNHAANLVVPVYGGDTATQIHARMRALLRENRHWAIWDVSRILGRLGPRRLHRVMSQHAERQPFAGASVITNFGRWEDETGAAWVALAPIARAVPSSLALVTVGGRLGVGVQIHPSLSEDPRRAQQWMDRFTDTAMNL